MSILILYLLAYFLGSLYFGVTEMLIAKKFGFSKNWFWMGFFLGIIGHIVIYIVAYSKANEKPGKKRKK